MPEPYDDDGALVGSEVAAFPADQVSGEEYAYFDAPGGYGEAPAAGPAMQPPDVYGQAGGGYGPQQPASSPYAQWGAPPPAPPGSQPVGFEQYVAQAGPGPEERMRALTHQLAEATLSPYENDRLSRLRQGMAGLQADVDAGKITPEQARESYRRLQRQAQPLMVRASELPHIQRRLQIEGLMVENSQRAAMIQAEQAFRARTVQDRVHTIPLADGRLVSAIEDSRGNLHVLSGSASQGAGSPGAGQPTPQMLNSSRNVIEGRLRQDVNYWLSHREAQPPPWLSAIVAPGTTDLRWFAQNYPALIGNAVQAETRRQLAERFPGLAPAAAPPGQPGQQGPGVMPPMQPPAAPGAPAQPAPAAATAAAAAPPPLPRGEQEQRAALDRLLGLSGPAPAPARPAAAAPAPTAPTAAAGVPAAQPAPRGPEPSWARRWIPGFQGD